MRYHKLWEEENEAVIERYQLSLDRIRAIPKEETVGEPFRSYFQFVSGFILELGNVWDKLKLERDCVLHQMITNTIEERRQQNDKLYEDILPEHYGGSYGNPSVSVRLLGEDYGQLLSFLYAEIRGGIVFVFESRLTELTILQETFIEIYNLFEGDIPAVKTVRDVLYWYISDYCDQTLVYRVRECVDPALGFAKDIVLHSDLQDLSYLYDYGEYVSQTALKTARFLNTLPEETICLMADTYTEGYRRGFAVMGRDLSRKRTVVIRYELGFEQMIRKAVYNFRAMGLEPILYRAPVQSLHRNPNRKVGYYGTSPNKQYEYDHRYDSALYLDKALKDRKLAVLRVAYEQYKKEAGEYAGPAVVETFGEVVFSPVNQPENCTLSKKQEELSILYANESAQIVNQYIPGSETSFTIIAFPVPDIGKDFEAIFRETIQINTLDYETYKEIQQVLIDALDQSVAVEVTGNSSNKTKIHISLHHLNHPEKETNFENCVADVNIPLGEVFTSPRLEATQGLLHVGSVYIGDIQFQNLILHFEHGRVTDYSCDNFESAREGKDLVKQVLLKNHDTLPMGEFAIGTNTTAYAMAERFGIIDKLPILIVEKMGPHFAVGDTCYSWAEDCAVYNPDGKEITARDNEISVLRREDVSKAYFNCHTDITIPYRELGRMDAIRVDGSRIELMRNGRFCLPGTEKLNEML